MPIDDCQHEELAPVLGSIPNEVVSPNLVGIRCSKSHAQPIHRPAVHSAGMSPDGFSHSLPRLGCLFGKRRLSRRQIRATAAGQTSEATSRWGEYRVDCIGHSSDQIAQKLRCNHLTPFLVEFGISVLRRSLSSKPRFDCRAASVLRALPYKFCPTAHRSSHAKTLHRQNTGSNNNRLYL